jgi:hypothetical protein
VAGSTASEEDALTKHLREGFDFSTLAAIRGNTTWVGNAPSAREGLGMDLEVATKREAAGRPSVPSLRSMQKKYLIEVQRRRKKKKFHIYALRASREKTTR